MAAGFNINGFRSVVGARGVARPNKFLVRLYMPNGLLTSSDQMQVNMESVRFMEFWADSASVPSMGLQLENVRRYGYGVAEKRPSGAIFTDISIQFMFDEASNNWQFFYDWLKMIYNTDMGQGVNTQTGLVNAEGKGALVAYEPFQVAYRSEYITDMEIKLYNQMGDNIRTFVLREAFPIGMGGMQLDWADMNSYLRIPVQFAFTDWYHGPIDPPISLETLDNSEFF